MGCGGGKQAVGLGEDRALIDMHYTLEKFLINFIWQEICVN